MILGMSRGQNPGIGKGKRMNVQDAIRNRRSIRDFTEKAIPEAAVEALIEALRLAPSAGNLQSRKFYFVTNPDMKQGLVRAALNQNFIGRAPLVVVGCIDTAISGRYGDRGVNLYAIQDVAAGVMSMMLAAVGLGLGTVWVGAFNEFEVFELLDLPHNLRPVAIIPVGYPAKVPQAPPRKSVKEVVEFVR